MLDQDITISSGASATLENVTLIAAPSNRTEWYWLTVSPNATLSINNSKVIGADKCPGISFKVQEEAKFVVTNSELRDLGDPTTIVGQFIELTGTNDALIANNVITGAHGVINLQGERASNVRIINNTISKSYFGIYIYDWENSAFTNNTISEVAQSSVHICFSTNCSIVGNTISDVWGFINWGSLTNTSFSNNRIINYNSGYIGHIDDSKVPINKALAASFTFTPSPSYANQPLAFDASPSTPGNGTITSYQWNLSDGATATGMTTTHSYTTSGNYSVTLNVTNSEGLWYTKTKIVTVQAPIPTPTPTPTPTSTPTPSPTPTATPAPTATPTPAPTATPTSQPTPTPTPTATPTLTESPSPTPATTAALPQEVIYVVAAAAITAIAVAVVILIRKQKK
jgi:parallel beta-helix repeat protein